MIERLVIMSKLNTHRLASQGRPQARRLVAGMTRRIPEGAVDALRQAFPQSEPGTLSHRIQNRTLRIMRFRGVPADVRAFSLTDNPSISLVNADSFIVEWLYWFGERYGYEPGTIYWWRAFCAAASGVLELGANIGYATVQGAKAAPTARYIAVEPHPGCARVCRENLRVNGIHNVEVVEAAALPDAGGEAVDLVLPGGRDHYLEAPATGFIGFNELHDQDEDMSRYTVVTVEGKEVSALLGDNTDLIKLDVEGQEHGLLSSISGYLRDVRPSVFVELLDDTPKLRSLILEVLAPAGYKAYVPLWQELVPLDVSRLESMSVLKEFKTRDIVLTCRGAEVLQRAL